jgi:hypothetical protein
MDYFAGLDISMDQTAVSDEIARDTTRRGSFMP